MVVEQNVEFCVREFYKKHRNISLFPQGQETRRADIDSALSVASKRGTGHRGAPDFIGIFGNDDKTLLVIECKADASKHRNDNLRTKGIYVNNKDIKKGKAVQEFACDGALHYAKHLAPHYNVIALGVSGVSRGGKIACVDYYYQLRGGEGFVHVKTDDNELLSPMDILRAVRAQPRVVRYRTGELIKTASTSYSVLSDLGVSPADRAFFIGMLLIALDDHEFNELLERESNFAHLLAQIGHCVCDRFDHNNSNFIRTKVDLFRAEMEKSVGASAERKQKLVALSREIKRHKDRAGANTESDELGAFFTSFLTKSSNSQQDQQELGIVLTPHHVTEIFPKVAKVQSNSNIVFTDSCCGTGGFLIAALKAMGEKRKSSTVINKNLWGVEREPKMYRLACLNMILKGGDASNIILGDSFDEEIRKKIKTPPNIAFLNPPYTMREGTGNSLDYDKHELSFVINACGLIKKGGTVVALMPTKSVASNDNRVNKIKRNLMQKNTVDGVFKLSNVTFEGVVNVETIIMVCTAGVPHDENHKVYFGNWEDDGMHFVRNIGPVDKYGAHDAQMFQYTENFLNKQEIKGESILDTIRPNEEWLYQVKLVNVVAKQLWRDFPDSLNVARHILNYCAMQIRLGDTDTLSKVFKECANCHPVKDPEYWCEFTIDSVLELTKGKRFAENQTDIEFKEYPEPGYVPYVSSSDIEEKQGLNGYIKVSAVKEPTHSGNYMLLNYGGGQLNCFYREGVSYCTDSLHVGKLRDGTTMNVYIATYLKEVINQYKPCFSYNLAPSMKRLRPLKIPLPVTADNKIDWEYVSYYGMKAFHEKIGKKPASHKHL